MKYIDFSASVQLHPPTFTWEMFFWWAIELSMITWRPLRRASVSPPTHLSQCVPVKWLEPPYKLCCVQQMTLPANSTASLPPFHPIEQLVHKVQSELDSPPCLQKSFPWNMSWNIYRPTGAAKSTYTYTIHVILTSVIFPRAYRMGHCPWEGLQ